MVASIQGMPLPISDHQLEYLPPMGLEHDRPSLTRWMNVRGAARLPGSLAASLLPLGLRWPVRIPTGTNRRGGRRWSRVEEVKAVSAVKCG